MKTCKLSQWKPTVPEDVSFIDKVFLHERVLGGHGLELAHRICNLKKNKPDLSRLPSSKSYDRVHLVRACFLMIVYCCISFFIGVHI